MHRPALNAVGLRGTQSSGNAKVCRCLAEGMRPVLHVFVCFLGWAQAEPRKQTKTCNTGRIPSARHRQTFALPEDCVPRRPTAFKAGRCMRKLRDFLTQAI